MLVIPIARRQIGLLPGRTGILIASHPAHQPSRSPAVLIARQPDGLRSRSSDRQPSGLCPGEPFRHREVRRFKPRDDQTVRWENVQPSERLRILTFWPQTALASRHPETQPSGPRDGRPFQRFTVEGLNLQDHQIPQRENVQPSEWLRALTSWSRTILVSCWPGLETFSPWDVLALHPLAFTMS
jgi:hypothetical protein